MPVTVVIGSQWGDEGKGKVVDLLAPEVDVVARYQGGANAGHTIAWGGDGGAPAQQFVLHLVPSGIFHQGVTCVIGNGVVIDPVALMEEIRQVEALGFQVEGRLLISHTAHLIMPYHKRLDTAREKWRDAEAIGTTGRGIGPAYVDKYARAGIRVVDLLDRDNLRARLVAAMEEKNAILRAVYGDEGVDVDAIADEYVAFDRRIDPFVTDTAAYLHRALADGKRILAEGAQGALLDVDHGTYPYVTSSHPTAGGCCTGLGVPPTAIDRVIGVTKAYSTRVGNGPFPTELTDDVGERLRAEGREFGATTGRPRRCGWLDLVALRYTAAVNGFTEAVRLENLDSGVDITCVMPTFTNTELVTGTVGVKGFSNAEPRDIAEAIAEVIQKPVAVRRVTRIQGALVTLAKVMPRKLGEFQIKKLGIDKVFLDDVDRSARAAYEERITHD